MRCNIDCQDTYLARNSRILIDGNSTHLPKKCRICGSTSNTLYGTLCEWWTHLMYTSPTRGKMIVAQCDEWVLRWYETYITKGWQPSMKDFKVHLRQKNDKTWGNTFADKMEGCALFYCLLRQSSCWNYNLYRFSGCMGRQILRRMRNPLLNSASKKSIPRKTNQKHPFDSFQLCCPLLWKLNSQSDY